MRFLREGNQGGVELLREEFVKFLTLAEAPEEVESEASTGSARVRSLRIWRMLSSACTVSCSRGRTSWQIHVIDCSSHLAGRCLGELFFFLDGQINNQSFDKASGVLASAGPPKGFWSCAACTLTNADSLGSCEVCGTVRGAVVGGEEDFD